MPERIRTSPPKCLYKKAMKRNRTENLKKQIKKSPQAIADFKIIIGDKKTDRLLCATLKISIIFVQLTI